MRHLPLRRGARPLASLAALTLLPLAAGGLTAPPASAANGDTIVYLKGGQIWAAHSDGSGARQLTTVANNWRSPSMADDGTVVVLGGAARINADGSDSDGASEIYRFGSGGRQLGKPIPTWGSYSTPSCPTYGPITAQVSPDGSKVAYGIFECGGQQYTTLWTPTTATGLSFPGQKVGTADFAWPHWVDNKQFMVSHVGVTVTSDSARWALHPVNKDEYAANGAWSDDRIQTPGAEAVANRQGTRFAVFASDFDNAGDTTSLQLFLYSSSSFATAAANGWSLDCTVTLPTTPDVDHLSPSFSSDGMSLYWGDASGVEVARLGAQTSGCGSVAPTVLIKGGSQPFVSPGPVPTGHLQVSSGATTALGVRVLTKHMRAHRPVVFQAVAPKGAKLVWSFGDGGRATGKRVRHTYAKARAYKVRLTATRKGSPAQRLTVRVRVTR